MSGASDETLYDYDKSIEIFLLDAEERSLYGLAEDVYALAIWETDSGFVTHQQLTPAMLEDLRVQCEAGESAETEEN